MSNVTVVSPFRDSGLGVREYIRRVNALDYPADALRFVCVEGDSTDDTPAQLTAWQASDARVTLVRCHTGKPRYGSIVHPERFWVLATVFNAGLDAVDVDWSDFVLFLPSDIIVATDLLTRLTAHDVDLVAPLTFLDGPPSHRRHYDTWAAYRNGVPLGAFPEVHTEQLLGRELVEMTRIGGTLLMRAAVVASGCRYTHAEVDHGLCAMATARGFRLWTDPMTRVYHP